MKHRIFRDAINLIAALACVLAAACGSSNAPASAPGRCSSDADCSDSLTCGMASGACVSAAGAGGVAGVAGMGGAALGINTSAQMPCTTKPQSGCPAGSWCLVANASGDTSCYSSGSVPYGGACSTINDCQGGLLCVYGQCTNLCAGVSDCSSAPYATCSPYPQRGSVAAIPGSSFCSIQCNPADPFNSARSADFAACLPGTTCSVQGSDGPTGATNCYLAGTVTNGNACNDTNSCAAGLICLTQGSSSSCTPMCLMGRTQCRVGSCQSFGTPEHVGVKGSLVELGYCG
jgi:hypothetical protein